MDAKKQDEKFEIKIYKVKESLIHRGRFFLEGEYVALNDLDAIHYEDVIEPYTYQRKTIEAE